MYIINIEKIDTGYQITSHYEGSGWTHIHGTASKLSHAAEVAEGQQSLYLAEGYGATIRLED